MSPLDITCGGGGWRAFGGWCALGGWWLSEYGWGCGFLLKKFKKLKI